MYKLIRSDAQTLGDVVVTLMKVGSRGRLIGHDRLQFQKRAGAAFLAELDKYAFQPGVEPVHILAIGTTEDYGPNRNGDGFRRATCSKYHDTFTKYARFYRNHLNKDPAKSYGIVPISAYHEPMRRIELLVGLNATKEAALRNGGLIADIELEKLARGDDIPTSMACFVPFDVCSYCGNRAKTPQFYCTDVNDGGHCKAGGLKKNMGRTVEIDGDIHQLHADNTIPRFCDISHVPRGADRISFVTGRLKAAADAGVTIGGAELATLWGAAPPPMLLDLDDCLLPRHVSRQFKMAQLLADNESRHITPGMLAAFSSQVQSPITIPANCREKFSQVLRALVDERCLLPVRDFIRLTTGLDEKTAADTAETVSAYLPGIYGRMLAAPDFGEQLRNNPYIPAPNAVDSLRVWALKQAAATSIAEPWLQRRVHLASMRQVSAAPVSVDVAEKLAAAGGPAFELAKHYAMYKLAFFSEIQESDSDLPLTAALIVLQNHAS